MPKNIEIKARIYEPDLTHKIAASLSDQPVKIIQQEDIFFHCDNGRLKLRILSPTSGELIHYQRRDTIGPKASTYHIVVTDNPQQLRAVLAAAYGEKVTVRKSRHLYIVGRTRIHVDKVDEIGDFLEFEVVISKTDALKNGESEARTLMEKFSINSSDLIDVSYADLLTQTQ